MYLRLVIYLLTYLLTYCMVPSHSWEANWFAASQEIPRVSRNPKVHYRTHKCPSTVSILGQPNQVHIPTSHLLEIHPNIIHPSRPRSPQWSPSLRFPHQDPIHPPLLTHTRHMSSPSHSSLFYHPHNIGWAVQIRIVLSPEQASRMWVFLNKFVYRKGLLAPCPTPNLEDRPSSAVPDCLFNLFAATLLIGGRSSIHNLRTRHALVTATHYKAFTS